MTKTDFIKTWSREAVNQPGIMVDVTALARTPALNRKLNGGLSSFITTMPLYKDNAAL